MFITDEGEIKQPFLRTTYNYDMHLASIRTGLECNDGTRTQQQFKEECDINTIVERFGLTGELPNDLRVPLTGDFNEVFDYHTAANKLREAQEAFMQMPAAIREQFSNEPGKFVDFVSDARNIEQCREWGLADPVRAPQGPIEVKVIPTPSEEQKT